MQTPYFIPLILSRSLAWLALALPAVALFGWDIAHALTTERALRKVLGPAISLAAWIFVVHWLARVTGSFSAGLVIGTLSIAALTLGWRLGRRRSPRTTTSSLGPGIGRFAWIAAFVITLPIIDMAFSWSFHDEDLYVGHLSMTSRILNDDYPPRHLTFPQFELRYHYGFNLLAACFSAIFRIAPDMAIDASSVMLWFYGALLSYTIGEIWLGRGRGIFTMLLPAFAGGLPICFDGKPFDTRELLGFCLIQKAGAVPPLISNFFQHPWALALPLAFATILVVTAREHQRTWIRRCVLILLLSTLSISEIVMFYALTPAVLATELEQVWRDKNQRARGIVATLVVGIAAVGLAVGMGGFFAPNPAAAQPSPFYLKWGVIDGIGNSLRWYAQSFGFLGPLGLAGVFFLPRRARTLMVLLLCGSLLVITVVHHHHSGDDLTWKFGVVVLMAMGLSAARIVASLWSGIKRQSRIMIMFRKSLVGVIMLGAMSGGLGFFVLFSGFRAQTAKIFVHSCRDMSRADFDAATYLRRVVKPGELVFRREPMAHRYAQWAGLSVAHTDWATPAFGFSSALLLDRIGLLTRFPPEPEPYFQQGVVWFVLDFQDTRLNHHVRIWISQGKAREMSRFGNLRVIKLEGKASISP